MDLATKQSNLPPTHFLDPYALLALVPVTPGMIVADFGCGNGYYSVAAGGMVGQKGQVYALDIMEDALSQTSSLSKQLGLRNVNISQCDLEKFGSCQLPITSCDLVILASLLHQAQDKTAVLREAYRILKTGGKLLVVEWKPEAKFGPPVADRISEQEVEKLLQKQGLHPVQKLPAGTYHYSLLYAK